MALTSGRSPIKMILLLLAILASLSAALPTPASTLSRYTDAFTEEQLLVGFELVKDMFPSTLDAQAVIRSIKAGTELELTPSQVQAMQTMQDTRRRSPSSPRDVDPCVTDSVVVCADVISLLASLFGISTRAGAIENSIYLSPEEARSLRGLIQTIGSSAASTWDRATGVWSLLMGLKNIIGFRAIIHSITQDLTVWEEVETAATIATQLGIWFGTDGLGFIAEVANAILGLVNLVEDALRAAQTCYAAPSIPASVASAQLTVAANVGGSLEVFLIDESLVPRHRWLNADGSWSNWEGLGGLVSQISVARNQDGRLEAFGLGTDNQVYHTWQDSNAPSGWSGWYSLGGWSSELVAASNSDGRLEVFAIGSNNRPYHRWQTAPNGGWSNWDSLSSDISLRRLSVPRTQNGALHVFGIGNDGAVYFSRQISSGSGWTNWRSLGGVVTALTAATSNPGGSVEVFATNGDNTAYHTWQNAPNSDSWSNWEFLSTRTTQIQQLTAAQLSGGQLIVFGIGNDRSVSYAFQDPNGAGGWTSWRNLGGSITKISLVMSQEQSLQVFAISTDKNLYVSHQLKVSDPTSWSHWVPLN